MKKIILYSVLVMLIASCKKGYLDINNNPNNPDNASPELVLANALNTTASRQITGYTFASAWMGQWAPSGSYAINSSDISSYRQTTSFADNNGLWTNIYNNLEDYDYVEKAGVAQSKPFFVGAAKIMKAYNFEQLVDMFNNIPYSQSLQGTSSITPVFDDGKDVYMSLFDELTTAIDLMKNSGTPPPASSDILFSGDATLWEQFANSLRLRLLIRQSEDAAQQGYINDKITLVKNEPYLTVDAGVNPGYSPNKPNPFWGFEYTLTGALNNDYWRAAKFGLDFYESNDDPRAHLVYGPTPANPSLYQGNILGAVNGNFGGPNTSVFGPGVLKSAGQPAIIMTAAESYFLQSEAALRGWIPGDPESLYKNGVQASFDYLGAGSANDYLDQPGNSNVYWAPEESTNYYLNLIIAQKWAAENCVTPFETWCDYRRLPNLPFNKSIPISQNPNVLADKVPTRIVYPEVEFQTNATNVIAQGSVDEYSPQIWWMP